MSREGPGETIRRKERCIRNINMSLFWDLASLIWHFYTSGNVTSDAHNVDTI